MDAARTDHLMAELTGLMPPPPVVLEAPPWSDAPARVGFAFPADYRAFANRCGFGGLTGQLPGLYLQIAIPVADLGDGEYREPFQAVTGRQAATGPAPG